MKNALQELKEKKIYYKL